MRPGTGPGTDEGAWDTPNRLWEQNPPTYLMDLSDPVNMATRWVWMTWVREIYWDWRRRRAVFATIDGDTSCLLVVAEWHLQDLWAQSMLRRRREWADVVDAARALQRDLCTPIGPRLARLGL